MIGKFHRRSMLLALCALLHLAPCNAQSDSLWRVWNDPAAPDSSRLSSIQTLAWKTVFENPDSGMALARQQLDLAIHIGDSKGRYEAYTTMAAGSSMMGDLRLSLEYLEQCQHVAAAMNDPQRESNTLSNMSNVYKNLGDMPKALQLLQKSLAIDERIGNTVGLAGTYNNMGNIHTELGDPQKALEHYERSDSLYTIAGDSKGRAQALLNLGVTHGELGDRVKALEELMMSGDLYAAMGRKMEMGMVHNNIGSLYGRMGDVTRALEELDKAQRYLEEIGHKRSLARTHFYKGEVLIKAGKAREAITHCSRGLELARENGMYQQMKECNECLMNAHEALGNYRDAFMAQQAYRIASDSIAALNDSREITRLEVTHAFQERQIADSLANVRATFERELAFQQHLGVERNRRNIVLVSGAGLLLMAAGLMHRLRYVRRSRSAIQRERDRSDELLHNILPREVAAELKEKGSAEARHFSEATILFTDFKGFTEASAMLTPAQLVDELNVCFRAFDAIIDKHGLEKIKTIGDAYMAAAGLPDPTGPGAAGMVQAALEMQQFMRVRRATMNGTAVPAFEMRAGIHTGPVVAGIVGSRKFAYDVWGDTVNVAARMESAGAAGQVNISSSTHERVRHIKEFRFTPRGKISVKGKGELEMFFVERAEASVHDHAAGMPYAIA